MVEGLVWLVVDDGFVDVEKDVGVVVDFDDVVVVVVVPLAKAVQDL